MTQRERQLQELYIKLQETHLQGHVVLSVLINKYWKSGKHSAIVVIGDSVPEEMLHELASIEGFLLGARLTEGFPFMVYVPEKRTIVFGDTGELLMAELEYIESDEFQPEKYETGSVIKAESGVTREVALAGASA